MKHKIRPNPSQPTSALVHPLQRRPHNIHINRLPTPIPQRANRRPHKRRPIPRRLQHPTPRPPHIQTAQHGRDNLHRGAECAPHDIPDILVAVVVPPVRDEFCAVVDCFLGLAEDFVEELCVALVVGWEGVVVCC